MVLEPVIDLLRAERGEHQVRLAGLVLAFLYVLAGLSTEDHLPLDGIRVPGIGKIHGICRQVEIELLAPAFQQKGARDLGTGAVPVFMDGVLSAVFADTDFHVPLIPVLSGDGDLERKTYELLAVLACADGGVAADRAA